ncbi:MAG: metallophosphatase family protein [Bacilli bacterium]|nr:metallophosphatase family protein [Bacilli bacterium]
MRIAIFSDVHGNKEALTSIIEDINKENIDEIICLGDSIGIGPNPSECMDMIIDNNVKMVLGNHELYFLKGTDIDARLGEDEKEHQKWIKEQITNRQREYIEKCPLTLEREYDDKKVLFEHFPVEHNSKDQYPFYDLEIAKDGSIKEIIESLDYDLVFIGHEHKNFCIDNELYDIGSVGCTNDNITKYGILDTDTFIVQQKRIEYDRDKFESVLLSYKYPCRDVIAQWFFGLEIGKDIQKTK